MNAHGNTQIEAVGYYLPIDKVKTSDMLNEVGIDRFGISSSYIKDNIGVFEVRHASSSQMPSDLAVVAAQNALAATEINKDHIDLIIFCGIEGDYVEPSTAHLVQAKLKLKSSICVDIQNACLGFMSSIQFADAMIAAGSCRYALIVTGERTSRVSKEAITELKATRNKTILKHKIGMLTVGDAGGALILGRKNGKGFFNFVTQAEGKHSKLCYYKNIPGGIYGQMNMGKIVTVTKNAHARTYEEFRCKVGWKPTDIDCLITQQVGARPFALYSEVFEVPFDKMTKTYPKLGNLTTATLPVNIARGLEDKMIRPGQKVFAAMSGSGISTCHAGFTV